MAMLLDVAVESVMEVDGRQRPTARSVAARALMTAGAGLLVCEDGAEGGAVALPPLVAVATTSSS